VVAGASVSRIWNRGGMCMIDPDTSTLKPLGTQTHTLKRTPSVVAVLFLFHTFPRHSEYGMQEQRRDPRGTRVREQAAPDGVVPTVPRQR
jgi:hypothetical protein